MTSEALEPEFIEMLCEDTDSHWPTFDGDHMAGVCDSKHAFVFSAIREQVTCPRCCRWLDAHPTERSWEAKR